MTPKMSDTDVRNRLAVLVTEAGSQKTAAKRLGVSLAYFHDVLRGTKAAGPKLLRALGYRRVYERIA